MHKALWIHWLHSLHPTPLSASLAAFSECLSPRLLLRPMVMGEARELLAVVEASRAELGSFMAWPREMLDLDHARRFIKLGREAFNAGRGSRVGIFERASGALMGSVEVDGVDPRRAQAELGYWVRSDRAGRGYATEAAAVMLRYAFGAMCLHKVRADVAVGNIASARVLDKLGFRHEGTLREDRAVGGQYLDHWRFGLLSREFTTQAERRVR